MLGRLKTRMKRVGSGASANRSDSEAPTTPASAATKAPPPSSAFRRSMIDYNAKVEELASFDSCVEACDALAASSTYAQSSVKRDKETGLIDCSVWVSPDGDLLLVPQDAQDSNEVQQKEQDEKQEEGDEKAPDSLADTEPNETNTPVPPAETPSKLESSSLFSSGHDDYESAVLMGNDLRPDRSINGFSAMGWSTSATTLAVRQTEQSMRQTAHFCETLILSQKEAAARTSDACDQLRAATGLFPGSPTTSNVPPMPTPSKIRGNNSSNGRASRWSSNTSAPDDYDVITALDALPLDQGGLEAGPNRNGPIFFSGGTLHAATMALEQYHSIMAENDSNRLRMASMTVHSQVGVLPALQQAVEQTTLRAYNREKALREMQQRVNAMENRLAKCKLEAKQRWDAVHDAEEAVTKIVEERMLERSRQREKRRIDQLREEEENRGSADLGATPGEIWDIVSAVAESMEDGSFAPTGLPDAPVAGPRDTTSGESTEGVAEITPAPSDDPVPIASRAEIEQEIGLPGLRAAAMAADEAIEDSAGSLLNILSTLDTTRRSARVAAEACLLSAGHAHAACLRSLVALEKAAIEDRLENIKDLERIVNNVDVRADLDAYISTDKKLRGGSARMGDDDDGGVASALAVLSSHVDGSMGIHSPIRVSTEGWSEQEEEEEITPERLEEAVEALFESNDKLHDGAKETTEAKKARGEFDKAVEFLCKTASNKSPTARARRSTICYALNSKRSSNAELECSVQFEGLCKVFDAILSGCDNESGGVSNAKMCMMLSQTFYMKKDGDRSNELPKGNQLSSPSRGARNNRVFVKYRLIDHPKWSDEEFWDQALYQCVTESLTHSGVMSNFERASTNANKSEWTETKKMKWHDLTQTERSEAASQVHAVVFAQLGALAHSMVEFGCGLERSCAFVRRMSIRNQLPISQRTMLLKHLIKRDDTP